MYRSLGDEAEDEANGRLIAAAQSRLDEPQRLEFNIRAMLNVMTAEQKALVHRQLQAAYIVDDAMTRLHERRNVIERATGANAQPKQ